MKRFIEKGRDRAQGAASKARDGIESAASRARDGLEETTMKARDGLGEASKRAGQTIGDRISTRSETNEETIRALEVMPEEIKLLYSRVLVLQAASDGDLDPREIASLYLFASRIDLQPESREKFRREISSLDASALEFTTGTPESDTDKVIACVLEMRATIEDDERDVLTSSLIKDMLWISSADGEIGIAERRRVEEVSERFFPGKAKDVIAQNEAVIADEEKYVRGEISAGQFEKSMKQTAAQAAAIGLPVAAIYFSGSVVGLSAAGFTSGLAALGLGGVLGLSAMLTGVGTILVLGVVTYTAVRYALGKNERDQQKRREHMIQEILKRHQKAMADLSEDIASLAMRMEEYLTRTEDNESRLSTLRNELKTFKLALSALKSREEVLEREERSFAT